MIEHQPFNCKEDMDLVHHQLIEQITRISVEEEEEAMKEEAAKNTFKVDVPVRKE